MHQFTDKLCFVKGGEIREQRTNRKKAEMLFHAVIIITTVFKRFKVSKVFRL